MRSKTGRCGAAGMTELRGHYPEIEPYETGMLDVGDGHRVYWERVGTRGAKPAVFLHGGQAEGYAPATQAVRPGPLRCAVVRPAWLRAFDPSCLARLQHDVASGRRHRNIADDGGRREMAGLRRLMGLDAGACLCRKTSRACQRTRLAQDLHRDQGGARLVLPVRRLRTVSRRMGTLCRADPRSRAR